MPAAIYRETFDQGPGGWLGFASNAIGGKPLEIKDSCAISRSPWWIDYNHAPPGAGYLNLLYILQTRGPFGEHQREIQGENQFAARQCPLNFTNARMTLKLRGELETRGTQLVLLVQDVSGGICSGWLLTGQPLRVTPQWSEQTVTCVPDESQWTNLGSRHDRRDFYGHLPLSTVLSNVNVNILLVLFPLTIAPMGTIAGDPHTLRPEKDYPVWRSRLPEGYVHLDEVKIEFAEAAQA